MNLQQISGRYLAISTKKQATFLHWQSILYNALTLTIGSLIGTTIAFTCFYEIRFRGKYRSQFSSQGHVYKLCRKIYQLKEILTQKYFQLPTSIEHSV